MSLGSAWGASGNLSGSGGRANSKQVVEQSGLFAEEGGYDINANKVHLHLEGGAIASTNPAQSELATNQLTFHDIENTGSVKTASSGLNGQWSNINSDSSSQEQAEAAKAGVKTGNTLMPTLPLAGRKTDQSFTRATLTEGKITLNRDSQSIVTTAAALGINTELAEANPQIVQYNLSELQQTQSDVATIVSTGANVVGAVSQQMGWEDGSPQKMALHGLVGFIAAKEGGGNLLTGAASGASSELLNTYVAEYLREHTELSPAERNAIQSLTAMGIGAAVGSLSGNNSESTTLGMNVARLAEENNRQIHPNEMQWIKENAKKFAQEQGISIEEAEQRLIVQAAQEVDFFWSKKIDNFDREASLFLSTASGFVGDVPEYEPKTFINIRGEKQILFSASPNERKETGLYSDKLKAYDEQNQHIFTRSVQPRINYQWIPKFLGESIENTALSAAYAIDNPVKTVKGTIFSIMDCTNDGECIKKAWNNFDSASGQLLGKGYNLSDVNYLYGTDMRGEIDVIQGARIGEELVGFLPVGKVASKVYSTQGRVKDSASSTREKFTKEVPNTGNNKDYSADVSNLGKNNASYNQGLNERITNKNVGETKNCSFRGDMEVETDQGYQAIQHLKVGDKVLAKNEITGKISYQKVQAHYHNPYDYTVYVEILDGKGKQQTIVSNKIHPFFTQVPVGKLPAESTGHHYAGDIAKAQWVDAQYLKAGYKLLSANGQWQTVKQVVIKPEQLSAYNLTVEQDHTYFIKAPQGADGVWVHNRCWNDLPNDAVATGKTTPDGRKLYSFKDDKGNQLIKVVMVVITTRGFIYLKIKMPLEKI